MQVVQVTKPQPVVGKKTFTDGLPTSFPWTALYSAQVPGSRTLFELEALVARRMDLLAYVDQQLNSPSVSGLHHAVSNINKRLGAEQKPSHGSTVAAEESVDEGLSKGAMPPDVRPPAMTMEEDHISHLLCRFAFCVDEKWRKWFMKTEETLMRARLVRAGLGVELPLAMLQLNKVACRPLTEAEQESTTIKNYLKWLDTGVAASNLLAVPMSLVPRLVKERRAVCLRGEAVIAGDHALELVLAIYRLALSRGLYEAFMRRRQVEGQELVWGMLDAFLTRYVADATDNLVERKEGTLRPAEVQLEAVTHMPLCMRRIDTHLRVEGHVKHTGRFMYGLFLKQLGLSMEDAMLLFSGLMTVKGGGSKEAFEKSSYGYNVRHNYGKEGKKTSYSSMSCATIIAMPPLVDRHDCHGCPFRFKDESQLRKLLMTEQPDPRGRDLPKVRPSASDIEEIIADSKGMHYTRACYRHYRATHPEAKRDTLFRSPYEVYCASKEAKLEHEAAAGAEAANSPGSKRQSTGTVASPDRLVATRIKTE